jgi:Leucine-rich repeat (LRR) protein
MSRLQFLKHRFNIFDSFDNELTNDDSITLIKNYSSEIISFIKKNEIKKIRKDGSEKIKIKKTIHISNALFKTMVDSDPSNKKVYTQWMLTVFNRLLNDNSTHSDAIRFVEEDLPLASEYLFIFEQNKRKKLFKKINSYTLKNISDVTNINQYKSLSQLYDAVDPFIERDSSNLEKMINNFANLGEAEILVNDRNFLVIMPKTLAVNVLFDKFTSWCTSKPNNGMFKHYTQSKNYLKPDGSNSEIYIVIDKRFLKFNELEDNFLYQIHFESGQVKNRKQNNKSDFYNDVLVKSEGVSNLIYEKLMELSALIGSSNNNLYLDYLIKFGWSDALFDLMQDYTPYIRVFGTRVKRLPDLTRFKNLLSLIITKSGLIELDSSIGNCKNLNEIILRDNKLTELPSEISNLKNLVFLNILGNKLTKIPDSIKYLDKTNGGKLHRMCVDKKDIGDENYNKLRQLLPSVKFK